MYVSNLLFLKAIDNVQKTTCLCQSNFLLSILFNAQSIRTGTPCKRNLGVFIFPSVPAQLQWFLPSPNKVLFEMLLQSVRLYSQPTNKTYPPCNPHQHQCSLHLYIFRYSCILWLFIMYSVLIPLNLCGSVTQSFTCMLWNTYLILFPPQSHTHPVSRYIGWVTDSVVKETVN